MCNVLTAKNKTERWSLKSCCADCFFSVSLEFLLVPVQKAEIMFMSAPCPETCCGGVHRRGLFMDV